MSGGSRLEVVGRDQVEAGLAQLKRDTSSVAVPSRQLVDVGLTAAGARVPVATGLLASSIEGTADAEGASLSTSVDYGPYQEFGTRYVAASRFMRAGFDAMSSSARDVYQGWLEDRISATGGTP